MKGGAPKVIKKFLKKDEAVAVVKKRFTEFCENQFGHAVSDEELVAPDGLEAFLEPLKVELARIQDYPGDDLIKQSLKAIPLNDLLSLQEIMAQKGARNTEEKVVKCMMYTHSDLKKLEDVKNVISDIQMKIATAFTAKFVSEYHVYQNGQATCNNEGFRMAIAVEIARREGTNEAAAGQELPHGCAVQ